MQKHIFPNICLDSPNKGNTDYDGEHFRLPKKGLWLGHRAGLVGVDCGIRRSPAGLLPLQEFPQTQSQVKSQAPPYRRTDVVKRHVVICRMAAVDLRTAAQLSPVVHLGQEEKQVISLSAVAFR